MNKPAPKNQPDKHIILTGGGTGGHIQPLVTVGEALQAMYGNSVAITVITERTARPQPLATWPSHFIFAGKFRRYHQDSWWQRLIDVRTIMLNCRDLFKVVIGYFQSLWLLLRLKPDIVFVKGGYVSLPVGLAAWTLGINYVTHDSDTLPGLTNRLLARGAQLHLTGFPAEYYPYPRDKTIHVGVPTVPTKRLTPAQARRQLKLSTSNQKLIFITGGSQGARPINQAIIQIATSLAELGCVVHQTGRLDYKTVKEAIKRQGLTRRQYQVYDFLPHEQMALYQTAADVVVSRAGATALAELAARRKAVIVIPNPQLTGGHQLTNAETIMTYDAGRILHQAELSHNPGLLTVSIDELLRNPRERQWLGNNLFRVFPPNSDRKVAELLMQTAHKRD